MIFRQQLNEIWDQQHRCPDGLLGWFTGEKMVRQHKPETDWTIDLLKIQPTDSVLEIGFGAGQGIKLAAEQASKGHVTGIDLSEVMVRVATRRNARAIQSGRVTLTRGNIAALPFEDQRFDKIMSIHTVYFWPEPAQALQQLYLLLKPAGRLVITLSTGRFNAQGKLEIWPLAQTLLEKQVLPGMQRAGFKNTHQEQGPTSRQYTSVAVTGEK